MESARTVQIWRFAEMAPDVGFIRICGVEPRSIHGVNRGGTNRATDGSLAQNSGGYFLMEDGGEAAAADDDDKSIQLGTRSQFQSSESGVKCTLRNSTMELNDKLTETGIDFHSRPGRIRCRSRRAIVENHLAITQRFVRWDLIPSRTLLLRRESLR